MSDLGRDTPHPPPTPAGSPPPQFVNADKCEDQDNSGPPHSFNIECFGETEFIF